MPTQAQSLRKAIENLINAKLHDALAKPGGVDRLIAHRMTGVASWEIRNAEKQLRLIALAIPSVVIGFLTIGPVLFGGYFGHAIHVMPANDVVGELKHEWEGPVAFAIHGLKPGPAWIAALGALTAWAFVQAPATHGPARRRATPARGPAHRPGAGGRWASPAD